VVIEDNGWSFINHQVSLGIVYVLNGNVVLGLVVSAVVAVLDILSPSKSCPVSGAALPLPSLDLRLFFNNLTNSQMRKPMPAIAMTTIKTIRPMVDFFNPVVVRMILGVVCVELMVDVIVEVMAKSLKSNGNRCRGISKKYSGFNGTICSDIRTSSSNKSIT